MRTSPFQLLKLSDVLVGVRGFDLLCQWFAQVFSGRGSG
jgi:hypothetical protein